MASLSALLAFVANIHIARHVDIDGISREPSNPSDGDLYLETVDNARVLVRTLEAALQSLYDDGSTLFLTAQSIRYTQSRQENEAARDFIDAIAACLKSNMDIVHRTMEALLAIGHEQADLSQGDYNGSIEWRMSRTSMTPTQPTLTHRPTSSVSVVDMAMAFEAPVRKASINPPSSNGHTTLNGSQDTASENTLLSPRPETPSGTLSDNDSWMDDKR